MRAHLVGCVSSTGWALLVRVRRAPNYEVARTAAYYAVNDSTAGLDEVGSIIRAKFGLESTINDRRTAVEVGRLVGRRAADRRRPGRRHGADGDGRK